MPPEQMGWGDITAQSDVFSLGIIMYEMITGSTPYPAARTAPEALRAMATIKPLRLSHLVRVPGELDRIVMRCIESSAARRYPSAAALRSDLVDLLEDASVGHASITPAPHPAACVARGRESSTCPIV
jgi:eukaryotic-like serine/threonine-protein kinase